MKKCMFICYGGGHVNTIIPVVKELEKRNQFEIISIGINLAADTFRKNGIPCKSLSSYMNKKVLKIGAPLAEKFHDFNSSVSFADSIAYYGFTMKDLIEAKGEELAYQILNLYDRRLFLPVESMKEILSYEKPDVVVTTTMHRFEAATIIAANELGIPSLRIEDLLGKINKPFPDKIQVKSIEEKEKLIKSGIKEEKILIEHFAKL
ncbi:hypothetical protein P4475_16650, partial [Halalkalibacterium halodurans]|uniref:hypothetical protein n=1 Tax=Halalkalibacterium halodurans TaxID=86665 RepID=UPI002E1C8856|nr:hypothetical protein [Halalkalibacterium halodurans]